jgi:hypothetical protein
MVFRKRLNMHGLTSLLPDSHIALAVLLAITISSSAFAQRTWLSSERSGYAIGPYYVTGEDTDLYGVSVGGTLGRRVDFAVSAGGTDIDGSTAAAFGLSSTALLKDHDIRKRQVIPALVFSMQHLRSSGMNHIGSGSITIFAAGLSVFTTLDGERFPHWQPSAGVSVVGSIGGDNNETVVLNLGLSAILPMGKGKYVTLSPTVAVDKHATSFGVELAYVWSRMKGQFE